jgi:hypothetical protein
MPSTTRFPAEMAIFLAKIKNTGATCIILYIFRKDGLSFWQVESHSVLCTSFILAGFQE